MWLVRVALDRPYTFIVLALMILIMSVVAIARTPTDIFPSIDIPVIAVDWTYSGLNPEELEGRLTSVYERALTATVDNIQHLESTTVNGQAIMKVFLQPGARLDTANAQITAVSQYILRQLPPGTLPPLIINYSASSVPILQLGLSGKGLSEQQLNDLGQNFLRTQLVTVPGAVVPYPYGGKQRQMMINLVPQLMRAKSYDASIAGYRQTTLTAFQEVEDNLAALRILEREGEQQDEAVESAKNNLRIFNDRYVGGRDSYIQVITAQTTYLDNERNQVDIRRRRMDATVRLVKALGGGWTASQLPTLDELTHSSTGRSRSGSSHAKSDEGP
jgi:Cu/Ag efflux pump CusA